MPKMLNDGAVEYEDGTPATEAQVKSHLTFRSCIFIRDHIPIFHIMLISLFAIFHRWVKMLSHF